MIESLDQVGMLFVSDLSRQECSTHTTTSQQAFNIPDSPTGHRGERGFFRRQQTHDGDKFPDVSDTRSHCFQSTRENSTLVRTLQSVRRNQTTRLALHRVRGAEYKDGPNKGFCTPRSAQETRIRTAQSARTQTCSRQSSPSGDGAKDQDRSTTPKRMTMNDANNAELFLMG